MRRHLSAPEVLVTAVLAVFGLITALATPLSAGYDEETHFIRAWEMAHLYVVPNEQLGARLPFPALYWNLSYRRQALVEPLEAGFWHKYGSLAIDAQDYVYANVETRSVYFPTLLLPQALTLRYLGLSLRWSALVVYFACRLAGLFTYILLCWAAVRLIPFGKWTLCILAMAPMAVFQASTISADTISNGIAFFVLAAFLAISRRKDLGWRDWLALVGLLALVFMAKVNVIYLAFLPFLLIPPSRFRFNAGYVLMLAAAVLLLLIEVAGWSVLAYSRFTRALEGAGPREQLVFILADLGRFAGIIGGDIWSHLPDYLRGWIGVYGYNYWPVPSLTYILYPLAVVASLWANDRSMVPDARTRLVMGILFVVGFLISVISLYVAFTPARSLFVAGVQGRYFTVVMPLLCLALLRPWRPVSVEAAPGSEGIPPWLDGVRRAAPILAVAALALYAIGLVLSYHVPCGSEYYRWALCYQPEYKNWAPESASSPPVTNALELTQEIVPACNRMTELRVWVNSRGLDPSARTEVLLRAPNQERDVFERSLPNGDLAAPGWLIVRFAPELGSSGRLYLLTIRGTSPNGISVGYSGKPEYLEGKLFENNVAVSQDVLFQYGCVAGLQELAGVGE